MWQDLSVGTKIFHPVTLTSDFDLLLKKLNLGINFWTERDWAFILHMCNPCGKTFLSLPKFSIPWPWPPTLTYFWKNLTLALTFELKEIGLSYFTCVFVVARPFCWNKKIFYLLSLTFDLLLKKFNLDHNFWTKSDRALILHISIPFCWYQYFFTYGPWTWLWPTFGKTGICCRGGY